VKNPGGVACSELQRRQVRLQGWGLGGRGGRDRAALLLGVPRGQGAGGVRCIEVTCICVSCRACCREGEHGGRLRRCVRYTVLFQDLAVVTPRAALCPAPACTQHICTMFLCPLTCCAERPGQGARAAGAAAAPPCWRPSPETSADPGGPHAGGGRTALGCGRLTGPFRPAEQRPKRHSTTCHCAF